FVFGLWRHANTAETRGYGLKPHLSLCGSQTSRRALHDFVFSLLWTGNCVPALFQYFRPPTGSVFSILWRIGEIYFADAEGRAADYLWGRQAKPRFYLYR